MFYLANTTLPQDMTEIVTGLRQLLDLKRIQQVNSQNAVIIRDTPDKLASPKNHPRTRQRKTRSRNTGRSAQARRDRVTNWASRRTVAPHLLRQSRFVLLFLQRQQAASEQAPLWRRLQRDSAGATIHALMTDSADPHHQDPELRSIDGQAAKLRVGDRVPVATGSFQAGSSAGINPLVNTQFQYIDVGVNADITPRVHPDHEVSLKVSIEVSSVTGTATIGGIQQPIISQRKIEHDIRLKEGEASILGGLFERIDTKTLNGWPGLAHIHCFGTCSPARARIISKRGPGCLDSAHSPAPHLKSSDLRPLSTAQNPTYKSAAKETSRRPS